MLVDLVAVLAHPEPPVLLLVGGITPARVLVVVKHTPAPEWIGYFLAHSGAGICKERLAGPGAPLLVTIGIS